MKLDVPFFIQSKEVTCGPTNLRMALAFFGELHQPEELKILTRQLDSGITFCQGIVLAAKKIGFNVKYYSLNFNIPECDYDYFKTHISLEDIKTFNFLNEEINKLGIIQEKKDLSIDELLSFVTCDSIPIVTINFRILQNRTDFAGHYVIVIGYDDDYIYVHNSASSNPQANMSIKKDIFLKAWGDRGADKNTIVISSK